MHALGEGAHILRVHDVAETRQALAMWRGIRDPEAAAAGIFRVSGATGNSAGEAPRSLFGTDGIRGIANQEPMTAEIAMKVGAAAGSLFVRGDHRHRVVIGKDTRLSGYLFEPALTAGFISVGMDVILVGPMPTPAWRC